MVVQGRGGDQHPWDAALEEPPYQLMHQAMGGAPHHRLFQLLQGVRENKWIQIYLFVSPDIGKENMNEFYLIQI